MYTTEIQKNIFQEENPKLRKEKIIALLKQKKARDKTKSKKNSKKSDKRIKKKSIQPKKDKIQNTLADDISLETNSTINTLDEESNSNNSEMLQYLDEIELVIKDIYSKGANFENLKKFIKIENAPSQIPEKNVNVKFLTENLKNSINSLNFSEKINLILDIDETLVYSKIVKEFKKNGEENKITEEFKQHEDKDIYYIKLDAITKIIIFEVHVRKNMTEFFRKLSPFCNFYINSMACPLYVKEVIDILCKNYGLKFSNINENNVIFTSSVNKKCLPEKITKKENFLILDDNICAWDTGYIPSIIPVRKFHISENQPNNIYYQYYLFSNKIYVFDEVKRPFLDLDSKIPYCVENGKEEKSQLFYMSEMIIKSYLLSTLLEIPIRHALHFLQNTILKDKFIFYCGYDKDFIYEMVNLLGGSIVEDQNKATHIIFNKNFGNDKKEINVQDKWVLDVKWVFDCFFKFRKCRENDSEYKFNIK